MADVLPELLAYLGTLSEREQRILLNHAPEFFGLRETDQVMFLTLVAGILRLRHPHPPPCESTAQALAEGLERRATTVPQIARLTEVHDAFRRNRH